MVLMPESRANVGTTVAPHSLRQPCSAHLCAPVEGPLLVAQLIMRGIANNRDDIVSPNVVKSVLAQILVGSVHNMAAFIVMNGSTGFAEVAARARLDLHENDFAQIFGNDVNFQVTKSPVALQNLLVLVHQMESSGLLAPLSDFVVL